MIGLPFFSPPCGCWSSIWSHTAGSSIRSSPGATTQPRGPYAPAIVVGLLGLLCAASVLLRELAVMSIDLVTQGPWIVVGVGVLLLLVGAVGIARRGR